MGAKRPEHKGAVTTFAAKVKSRCAERDGGLQYVADEIGISRVQLSRIVNGHCVPSLETVDRIAGALGVTIQELVTPERRRRKKRRRKVVCA